METRPFHQYEWEKQTILKPFSEEMENSKQKQKSTFVIGSVSLPQLQT